MVETKHEILCNYTNVLAKENNKKRRLIRDILEIIKLYSKFNKEDGCTTWIFV